MTEDQLFETKQAVQMLVAAFSDVEQTLNNFVDMSVPSEEAAPAWHTAAERPQDGMVVVLTKDGCKYFQSVTNGRLMPNVKWWLQLPKDPE